MAVQQSKPWYQSTTVIVNLIGIAVIALQYGINLQLIPTQYQELALAVFNVLNRFRTSQPVSLT